MKRGRHTDRGTQEESHVTNESRDWRDTPTRQGALKIGSNLEAKRKA